MSLKELVSKYNLNNCKISLHADDVRYICFTQLSNKNGTWCICITDGILLWIIEFELSDLEACISVINQPTVDGFLSKFRDIFNEKDASVRKDGDQMTLSLTPGVTFDLIEATAAKTKSELQSLVFNIYDDYISTKDKLDSANSTIMNMQTHAAAGKGNPLAFMDLGPKKAHGAKNKIPKEGMSAVNPLSKKRKAAQDESLSVYESTITKNGSEMFKNGADSHNYIEVTNTDVYDHPDAMSSQWSHSAVLKLIDNYGKFQKRFLIKGMKKKHVWQMISVKLQQDGLNMSAGKCENKWKNITRVYRQAVNNGVSCPYYDEITQVLQKDIENIEDDDEDDLAMKIIKSGPRDEDGKTITTLSWSKDAILNLIKQYNAHKHFFTQTSVSKKHVWNLIAAEVEHCGYQVTASQCAIKWRHLTRQYKNVMEAQSSIDQDVKPGDFFTEVQEIYESETDDVNTDVNTDVNNDVSNDGYNDVNTDGDNSEIETSTDSKDKTTDTAKIFEFLDKMNKREIKDQKDLLEKLTIQHKEKAEQEERKLQMFQLIIDRLPVNN